MADEQKKTEPHKPSEKKHEEHKGEHKPATPHKPAEHKAAPKTEQKAPTPAQKPTTAPKKETGAEKKAADAQKRAAGKSAPKAVPKGAAPAKKDDVKIVDKPKEEKHKAQAKPTLTESQRKALALRAVIDARRPRFRRQQWYEYKRLANTGWRKPTGVDSAMRRHFGYEQSVVRIGFGGPKEVRGLHPSGFREVFVDQIGQLKTIDKKTQAARVSGNLGARKLRDIYVEADKLGVRVLNRRELPPAPKASGTKPTPKGGQTQ
jgi:large subunit ribosomal protein L32e